MLVDGVLLRLRHLRRTRARLLALLGQVLVHRVLLLRGLLHVRVVLARGRGHGRHGGRSGRGGRGNLLLLLVLVHEVQLVDHAVLALRLLARQRLAVAAVRVHRDVLVVALVAEHLDDVLAHLAVLAPHLGQVHQLVV